MSLRNLSNAYSAEMLTLKTPKMTFFEKFKYVCTHITVEPLIFFYILPGTMGNLASQNLYLEKACRVNLQFNSSVCDGMVQRNHDLYTDYQEAEVQKLVANMLTIKTAVIGFFPTILMLFFGSWSDRHKRRKPIILFPILCDVISGLELIICAYFFLDISIEYVTFADCFPFAIGGGWSCVFVGIFSYVSGLSSDEDRTIRIGTVSMLQSVAVTIGNVLGGISIKPLGIIGAYVVVITMMACSFFYGLIFIKDTPTSDKIEKKKFLSDFLDVGHVKKTFQICFKQGPSNRKWKTVVIMLATVLIAGPLQGELTIIYLYTRKKFGWNEVNFSIFNTLQFVIQLFGSIFALSYFSKKLNLDDATLGIIALISKISACIIYAFAPTGGYLFIGCLVEIFNGTCYISLRSIMNKIVPPHELGQSNSVFGVCEAIMPLIFGPFYATLYNYTINFFPGGFYLVSATLYLMTLPLFVWLYKSNQKDKEMKKQENLRLEQEEELIKKSQEKKAIEMKNF